ncbi:hypothetical protein AAVH_39648, partial [Aphelenchoides avenae]
HHLHRIRQLHHLGASAEARLRRYLRSHRRTHRISHNILGKGSNRERRKAREDVELGASDGHSCAPENEGVLHTWRAEKPQRSDLREHSREFYAAIRRASSQCEAGSCRWTGDGAQQVRRDEAESDRRSLG